MSTDQRLAAFCSHQELDVFHPVTHQHQIWQPDPYDVEAVHSEARSAYDRLLNRLGNGSANDSGRILLLLGESGAGKTHLMRVFRNQTHEQMKGFFSYMQMTSAVSNYARYVLRNTIDSFDKPYYTPFGSITGLMKFSNCLAESSQLVTAGELNLLRENDLSSEELLELIYPIADRVVTLEPFSRIDLDLIRALLYLQPGNPAINAKVFKLLRCEPLTPYDSKVLGGMASRDEEDDPLRMLRSIALLIRAITDGALVVCLDQLEDIHSMEEADDRFRRAMQTIVTLAEIPNIIVVLSCLEEFYQDLKKYLPRPHVDRLELDPAPTKLKAQRSTDEIALIISQRLQHLYESADVDEAVEANRLYPFRNGTVDYLVGQNTRNVLEWCRSQREHSIATGELPSLKESSPPSGREDEPFQELSQLWNDHLTGTFPLPEGDLDLLHLLRNSIERCGQELGDGYQFMTRPAGEYLIADIQTQPDTPSAKSLILGLCQKSVSGGALLKQIQAIEATATSQIPVILRTTEFPSKPTTKTARKIGELISKGWRRAVVADSDWRTMVAIQSFEQQHRAQPSYSLWLQIEKPLSQLPSLQKILDLSNLKAGTKLSTSVQLPLPEAPPDKTPAGPISPPSEPPKLTSPYAAEATLPEPHSAIHLGHTRNTISAPVELEPKTLVRHGAILGSTGSGKTTLALAVIEQLLLRGIPAILLDRKGDLCSYANPDAWTKPSDDAGLLAHRQLLRDHIDVAVYTPGTVGDQGRPLSIAITPPGLGQFPSHERLQIANYCARALGGILGYKQTGQDKTRTAILGQAIAVLSELQTDNPLNVNRLIEFIAEADPLLVNAIGYLDPKHCKKLAENLQTLSLMTGYLFSTQYEQLSTEQLLTSPHPEKTRLSVINLGNLGDNANILFWVSQFLLDLNRYAQKHPSGNLQAVVLFDEADLYLPAVGKPSTKEPMESLLKRARAAGLGILLATQSPGDLDYKCRDQISSWFVGKITQPPALAKLKPLLSEAKVDVSSKLANQRIGEFFLLRAGNVTSLKSHMSLIQTEQVPIDKIQAIAVQSIEKRRAPNA